MFLDVIDFDRSMIVDIFHNHCALKTISNFFIIRYLYMTYLLIILMDYL